MSIVTGSMGMDREHVQELLHQVTFSYAGEAWSFELKEEGGRLHLRTTFRAPCCVTGEPQRQNGRWWPLSLHMTRSEVVGTAFLAVLTAVEHEVRESFTFHGERIYGPHHDVDALAAMCRTTSPDARQAPRVSTTEAEA